MVAEVFFQDVMQGLEQFNQTNESYDDEQNKDNEEYIILCCIDSRNGNLVNMVQVGLNIHGLSQKHR